MEGCQSSGMTASCMGLLFCQNSPVHHHHHLLDAHRGWCIPLSEYPAAVHGRLACLTAVVALQSQQARGGYANKHEHDFSHAPWWHLLLRPAPTKPCWAVKCKCEGFPFALQWHLLFHSRLVSAFQRSGVTYLWPTGTTKASLQWWSSAPALLLRQESIMCCTDQVVQLLDCLCHKNHDYFLCLQHITAAVYSLYEAKRSIVQLFNVLTLIMVKHRHAGACALTDVWCVSAWPSALPCMTAAAWAVQLKNHLSLSQVWAQAHLYMSHVKQQHQDLFDCNQQDIMCLQPDLPQIHMGQKIPWTGVCAGVVLRTHKPHCHSRWHLLNSNEVKWSDMIAQDQCPIIEQCTRCEDTLYNKQQCPASTDWPLGLEDWQNHGVTEDTWALSLLKMVLTLTALSWSGWDVSIQNSA